MTSFDYLTDNMLPMAMIMIWKGVGIYICYRCLKAGLHEIRAIDEVHANGSNRIGNTYALCAYRMGMFCLTFAIGSYQAVTRGAKVFRFFTVWNWWLIVLYFFFASLSSISSTAFMGLMRKGTGKNSRLLYRIIVSFFHVILPMTLFIDIVTWTVLVPMLLNDKNPEKVLFWRAQMYSWISYMQHGGNAIIMTGEMLLNNIPYSNAWSHGVVALWNILFGIWSLISFALTGNAIYPFLDYSKKHTWVSFICLFQVGLLSSYIVQRVLLQSKVMWLHHHHHVPQHEGGGKKSVSAMTGTSLAGRRSQKGTKDGAAAFGEGEKKKQ